MRYEFDAVCKPSLPIELLRRVNILREERKSAMTLKYSYGEDGESAHASCMAIDFDDPKHEHCNWIVANPNVLEKANLWMADPSTTLGVCHLQSSPADTRIFKPE